MQQLAGDESARLSALIGTVYDASIDPSLWPDALAHACRFLDCKFGVIGAADVLHQDLSFVFQWGYEARDWQSYMENYHHKNPNNLLAFRTQIGQVLSAATAPRYEEFLSSEFYTDWAAPLGIVDAIQATLDKTGSAIALLNCVRHKDAGVATAEEIRRMGLIQPHFRRAVLIGKLLDMRTLQATAFAQAIDGLRTGVFLVSSLGELVHANVSGQAMLDAEDPLKLERGALVASDPGVQATLRNAFAATLNGDSTIDSGGMALPISTEGGQFIAHVLPLTAGLRRNAGTYHSAAAALFVRHAEIDVPSAINAAAQLYGFTPAEQRVLRAVIEVGGVDSVATMLGTSRSTVKTHLEHLFEKTGAGRQAELVKLITGFESPVRARSQAPRA
jgi:DNA-binding CsgD family transcriptional regulator